MACVSSLNARSTCRTAAAVHIAGTVNTRGSCDFQFRSARALNLHGSRARVHCSPTPNAKGVLAQQPMSVLLQNVSTGLGPVSQLSSKLPATQDTTSACPISATASADASSRDSAAADHPAHRGLHCCPFLILSELLPLDPVTSDSMSALPFHTLLSASAPAGNNQHRFLQLLTTNAGLSSGFRTLCLYSRPSL